MRETSIHFLYYSLGREYTVNMNDDEKARIARRKAKFSEQRRQELLDDPLKDKSLLSRSTADNETTVMMRLKTNQTVRDQMFVQIQELARSGNSDDEVIEHGLRKLREIIVSIYHSEKRNDEFMNSVKNVYIYSIEFYLGRRPVNWTKLVNILEAFVRKVSGVLECKEHGSALVLYEAIEQQQYGRSLQIIQGHEKQLWDPVLCRLIVKSCATDNFHLWFYALSKLDDKTFLYKFLITLPYHEQAVHTVLNIISRSYHQLTLAHITEFWFQSVPIAHLKDVISSRWTVNELNHGSIVKFRK